MAPIRVLHCVAGLGHGGYESLIMNLYRNIDREKVQFDFVSSFPGVYEPEIEALGGRIHRIPFITQKGPFVYTGRPGQGAARRAALSHRPLPHGQVQRPCDEAGGEGGPSGAHRPQPQHQERGRACLPAGEGPLRPDGAALGHRSVRLQQGRRRLDVRRKRPPRRASSSTGCSRRTLPPAPPPAPRCAPSWALPKAPSWPGMWAGSPSRKTTPSFWRFSPPSTPAGRTAPCCWRGTAPCGPRWPRPPAGWP